MDLNNIEEKLNIILQDLSEFKHRETLKINGEPYQSEETAELNTALAKASLEFPVIVINRQNPYLASGYADLHEIMIKIRPILGKFGLHIVQQIKPTDGATILCTRIWHSSGQWIESRVFINPSKNTVEAYGSNLNSMKRFEVMDLIGITVTNDPFDDDGEADMEIANEVLSKESSLKALYKKKNESYDLITTEQYGELMIELDTQEELTQDILEKLHIKSFRELPRTRFLPTINRIRKINVKNSKR